jgi:predicted nucleic acid-binding protein
MESGWEIFLVDTSALVRRQTCVEVREILDPLVRDGEAATCGIIDLEVLYGASSPRVYGAAVSGLQGMPRAPVEDVCVSRALEVQATLASRSQHRGLSIPDLLIAACAEVNGLTVLHYDADFERISAVTDQPTRWVVPRGSVS